MAELISQQVTSTKTTQQCSKLSDEERIAKDLAYFASDEAHAYLFEKAKYYNSIPGDLKFYDCKKCLNKGVIEYITDDYSESCKVCSCMKIRSCYQAMANSGITQEAIERMTFDSFKESEHEWQTRLKHTAIRYAESDLSKWLLLSGQSGCGKTHLCTAVSKWLMENGRQVKYVLWHDAVRKLAGNKYNVEVYDKYMDGLRNADVLYIDDMFKSEKTEKGIAFEIINARYISRKPTIISTELSLSDIEIIDPAISSRIYELSSGFIAQVKADSSRNYRTGN